jgi:hypothetical protein
MMKQRSVMFLFLLGLFVSCSQCSFKSKTLPLVQLKIESETDSSFYHYRNLSSSFYSSVYFNHRSFQVSQGEGVYVHLNSTHDSLYIVYSEQKRVEHVAIPFEKIMPVSNLYYHNDDSIFVFYERDAVVLFRDYGFESDDFIMMDIQGRRKDSFRLDDVSHIYNGQLNPMINIGLYMNNTRLIHDGVLYIPFSI